MIRSNFLEEDKKHILNLYYKKVLSEQFNPKNGTYVVQKDQQVLQGRDLTTKNWPKIIKAGTVVFHDYKKNDGKIKVGNLSLYTRCNRDTFIYNESITDLKSGFLMTKIKETFCNGGKLKTWQQLTGTDVSQKNTGPSNNTNNSQNTQTNKTLKDIQAILIQRGFLQPGQDDNKATPETLQAIQKALSPSSAGGTNAGGANAGGTNAGGTNAGETNAAGTQPQSLDLQPGLIGFGFMNDEAQGRTMVVTKVTPLSCGITEVEFKWSKYTVYGYYKPSELNDNAVKNREIFFKRYGEGLKAEDACKQYDTDDFERAGELTFGTKPNEKPVRPQ